MKTRNLLHEVLCDDDLTALRDATMSAGLDALRRRRRRRLQLQTAAILALLLVFSRPWLSRRPPPVVKVSTPQARTAHVKYITKQELFALFPNRPIALIGAPGHQQFLLLDELPRRPMN